MALENVMRVDNGKIVGSQAGSLSKLKDVDILNVSNKDILIYNETNQKWENEKIETINSSIIPVNPVDTTNLNIWIETDS